MAETAPIIIKKRKKSGHAGHHGGAWKVAYADFVTAMMAFFLLMWLINATSPEQKKGIADYFAPAAVSESRSGSGGVLGGKSFDSDGARDSGYSSVTMSSRASSPRAGSQDDVGNKNKNRANDGSASGADAADDAQQQAQARQEAAMFESAAMSLRQAMRDMPELAALSKNLLIDQTPEGMRIQIIDQEGRSMFPPGEAVPYARSQILFREVAKVIRRLPNRIIITGHTDASKVDGNDGYSNWELSSDRANATRRIFQDAGIESNRIYEVSGKAGSEPLFPDDPYMSANRRISILLKREAPVLPPDHSLN